MEMLSHQAAIKPSSPLIVAIAWLIVAIPAGWGVEQTFVKSLALFRQPTTAPVSVSASVSR